MYQTVLFFVTASSTFLVFLMLVFGLIDALVDAESVLLCPWEVLSGAWGLPT